MPLEQPLKRESGYVRRNTCHPRKTAQTLPSRTRRKWSWASSRVTGIGSSHSFASNCAAAGVDQRVIDEWMGHQTEEMVRRYRHLFPSQQRQAINLVFG